MRDLMGVAIAVLGVVMLGRSEADCQMDTDAMV
jgi:hypothetical protein